MTGLHLDLDLRLEHEWVSDLWLCLGGEWVEGSGLDDVMGLDRMGLDRI